MKAYKVKLLSLQLQDM